MSSTGKKDRDKLRPVSHKMRIGAAMLSVVLMTAAMPSVSYASSTTRQQIREAESQRQELQNRLDQTQDTLEELRDEHSSLQGQLNSLNKELTAVSDALAELEEKIVSKNEEIRETQALLEEAKETERRQYESMKKRIQYMYEKNDNAYMEALFHATSFGDFLNLADYFEQLAVYDQNMLHLYEENRQYIEAQEARLEEEKAELETFKEEARRQQEKVSGLISATSGSIASYAGQISDAEAKAKAYEDEIRKKEEDLTYLKKKLAEEIAKSRQAANATWRNISEVTFAEGDRMILANIIYCEAGNQPYEGQLAVGAVVINRVLSSVFPDTVVGVVYQRNQFSPVGSGRLDLALASDKATASCYRAADEAMSGVTNVGSCVFFRTPVEGLSGITIGGHVFY